MLRERFEDWLGGVFGTVILWWMFCGAKCPHKNWHKFTWAVVCLLRKIVYGALFGAMMERSSDRTEKRLLAMLAERNA